VKRRATRMLAAGTMAALTIGLMPSAASAHDCEDKRGDSFHSPGNEKEHCRAKK